MSGPKHEKYNIVENDGFIDIPGYVGLYQMNTSGIVRRILQSGSVRNLTPYKKNGSITRSTYVYDLVAKDGSRKHYTIGRLYCLLYGINVPEGKKLYQKSNNRTDFSLENYVVANASYPNANKSKSGKKIVKVNKVTDIVVKTYNSVEKAARYNNCSRKTIRNICQGKRKNSTVCPGYVFMYADDYYKEVD